MGLTIAQTTPNVRQAAQPATTKQEPKQEPKPKTKTTIATRQGTDGHDHIGQPPRTLPRGETKIGTTPRPPALESDHRILTKQERIASTPLDPGFRNPIDLRPPLLEPNWPHHHHCPHEPISRWPNERWPIEPRPGDLVPYDVPRVVPDILDGRSEIGAPGPTPTGTAMRPA